MPSRFFQKVVSLSKTPADFKHPQPVHTEEHSLRTTEPPSTASSSSPRVDDSPPSTAVNSPLSTVPEMWIAEGANGFFSRSRISRIHHAQDALTHREEKVYDVLWGSKAPWGEGIASWHGGIVSIMRHMVYREGLSRVAGFSAAALILASVAATLSCFPWDTDPQGDQSASGAAKAFYTKAYSGGKSSTSAGASSTSAGAKVDFAPLSAKEQFYVDIARKAAIDADIPDLVNKFVSNAGLKGKRVLEVGAGSGLLQDVVNDYTGLDISPTARRFFHKPFVEASATDMPFPDKTFDGVWSIWVLEHIPNPEKALLEIRRVLKAGGYLLLYPAFDVSRYAAQGYGVRPVPGF